MEVLHWLEVMQLEQDIYATPPTIPTEVYDRQLAISRQIMKQAKRVGRAGGSSIDNINMGNGLVDKSAETVRIQTIRVVTLY
jgi:hypothetical protein